MGERGLRTITAFAVLGSAGVAMFGGDFNDAAILFALVVLLSTGHRPGPLTKPEGDGSANG